MAKTVRARYMGGVEALMRVGDEEVLLKHRHLYELPEEIVKNRDDFKIQEEEIAEEVVEDTPRAKTDPRVERAVDTAPRENG